jgi:hypothetical protein
MHRGVGRGGGGKIEESLTDREHESGSPKRPICCENMDQ